MKQIYILAFTFILMTMPLGLGAQEFQWVTGGGGIGDLYPDPVDEATDYLTTDEHGNVYAASVVLAKEYRIGDIWDTVRHFPYSKNLAVFSLDSEGKTRWNKTIESKTARSNHNGGLLYDNNNGVYWSGAAVGQHVYIEDTLLVGPIIRTETSTIGPLRQHFQFLIKYDTLGEFKWLRLVNTPTVAYSRILTSDPAGNLHLFRYNVSSGDTMLPGIVAEKGTYDIAYSPDGDLLQVRKLDLDSTWILSHAAFYKDGKQLFAIGRRNLDLVPNSITTFVAVFDEQGNKKWFDTTESFQFNEGEKFYCGWTNMTYDDEDYFYVFGSGWGAFKFRGDSLLNGFNRIQNNKIRPSGNVFVCVKMDIEGNVVWMKKNDGSGTNNFTSSTLLHDGRVAATGHFPMMIIDMNGDTLTRVISEIGSGSVHPFFMVMDSSGHVEDIRAVKANATTSVNAIAAFKNNLYIGGETDHSVWADTSQPPYRKYGGPTDFFVLKYGYPPGCDPPQTAFAHTLSDSMEVRLSYTGSRPIDSILWDFGDGNVSKDMDPVHAYSDSGDYYICATAYNACGGYKTCQKVHIEKKCPPLEANFVYQSGSERTFHFEYTGSLPVDSVTWMFGDGHHATGLQAEHEYALPGDYQACAIAYNDCGEQSVVPLQGAARGKGNVPAGRRQADCNGSLSQSGP